MLDFAPETTMTATPSETSSRFPWGKVVLGIVALVVLVGAYRLLPISEWVESFQSWVGDLGAVGWIVFIVVYALTVFVLVPGSILTLAAGVAFGIWGFPIVMAGATFGSAISFLAARYVFHDRVQERLADYPKFNAVNQMRLLGRWMRMVTIPNQSSVAKAWQEFEADRMKPSSFYDRVVDVMEELVKFTILNRGNADYLTSRYSERKNAIIKQRELVDANSV